MKLKKYYKSFGLYAIIFIIVLSILAFINQGYVAPQTTTYTYSDLFQKIEAGEVSKIYIQNNSEAINYGTVKAELKDGTVIQSNVPSLSGFSEYIDQKIVEDNLDVTVEDIPKTNMLGSILPSLIMMILAVVIFSFMFQKMQGGGGKMMSFGKSKAKVTIDDKNRVTFDNVAGLDEEKAELSEIVEFLKDSKKFLDLGARIPKGVLLVGPPGTGKTLLAKAVAGEAKVPFFSISGSDFVEMFVGVGASRVRDLFDQAKKNAPCIVFIDEIDAVGRRRGAGLGGGHDEREQTLNQLLVEMDGFGINEGVIVVAATNRADILDPAILRPGRFDRQVYVGRPDVKGREAILKVHAKGKPLADDVDLSVVAKTTSGFTGADLQNLLNEAALLSARDGKKKIDMEEIQKHIEDNAESKSETLYLWIPAFSSKLIINSENMTIPLRNFSENQFRDDMWSVADQYREDLKIDPDKYERMSLTKKFSTTYLTLSNTEIDNCMDYIWGLTDEKKRNGLQERFFRELKAGGMDDKAATKNADYTVKLIMQRKGLNPD